MQRAAAGLNRGRLDDAPVGEKHVGSVTVDAREDEVLHEGGPGREDAEENVRHKLRLPTGGFLLWEDDGDTVSFAGWGGPTPNGIRVGPVYTPPELRGRGYATALTAELSQRLLDGRLFEGGRRFCFLYTDLANPTSNRLYPRIGYRPVHDAVELCFTP